MKRGIKYKLRTHKTKSDIAEDIEGSPLSNFVELLARISRSAETISTLSVVNIPATHPLRVSCQ